MKVLLRKNVTKLGKIGEVVEVKVGYARNYLLPQALAVKPTKANVRAVEMEKQEYLEEVAERQKEFQARADEINGKEVTISALATEEGHLYGSVGPAQIAAALAKDGVFIEVDDIVLDSPIRQLDKYNVKVSFAEDVTANIAVWIVPIHEESHEEDEASSPDQSEVSAEGDGDSPEPAEPQQSS